MSAASVQHISNPTFLRPISHPTLVLQQLITKSLLKTQYKPWKLFHPPFDPLFVVEESVATDRLSGWLGVRLKLLLALLQGGPSWKDGLPKRSALFPEFCCCNNPASARPHFSQLEWTCTLCFMATSKGPNLVQVFWALVLLIWWGF